jgi:hypothetical protein
MAIGMKSKQKEGEGVTKIGTIHHVHIWLCEAKRFVQSDTIPDRWYF